MGIIPLVLGLVAAPALAAAQDTTRVVTDSAEAVPDVVYLYFDWPVGTSMQVEVERSRRRTFDATTDSSRLEVDYQLDVEDHEQGRLIRFSEFSTPDLGVSLLAPQEVLQAASSFVPAYVVSDEGDILAVEGLEELGASLRAMMHQVLDTLANPELEAILGPLLNEDNLFAQAATEWNSLVGTWIEAEFDVGYAYEMEVEEPLPMIGNALVPYIYELGASARVPCLPEEEELRCVELVMRTYPDPEVLQPLLDQFVQNMMNAVAPDVTVPALVYKTLDIENEVILVTEPAGLIPYALTVGRYLDMVVEVGGEEQAGSEVRLAEYTYRRR